MWRNWPIPLRCGWIVRAWLRCLALSGWVGGVPPLVDKARSGRRIIALDGCPLQCVQACLRQHDLVADVHVILNQLGLRKRFGVDCGERDMELVFSRVVALVDVG